MSCGGLKWDAVGILLPETIWPGRLWAMPEAVVGGGQRSPCPQGEIWPIWEMLCCLSYSENKVGTWLSNSPLFSFSRGKRTVRRKGLQFDESVT